MERGNISDAFRRGTFRAMVVTDVAARGLDVPACDGVLNLVMRWIPTITSTLLLRFTPAVYPELFSPIVGYFCLLNCGMFAVLGPCLRQAEVISNAHVYAPRIACVCCSGAAQG